MNKTSYEIQGNTQDYTKFYIHGLNEQGAFGFIIDYGTFNGQPKIIHLDSDLLVTSSSISENVKNFQAEGWTKIPKQNLGFLESIRQTSILARNRLKYNVQIEPKDLPNFEERMTKSLGFMLKPLYDSHKITENAYLALIEAAIYPITNTQEIHGIRATYIGKNDNDVRQMLTFTDMYNKAWPAICNFNDEGKPKDAYLLDIRNYPINKQEIEKETINHISYIGIPKNMETQELDDLMSRTSDELVSSNQLILDR